MKKSVFLGGLLLGLWLLVGVWLIGVKERPSYFDLLVINEKGVPQLIASDRMLCAYRLNLLSAALMDYAREHRGQLPPARGANDYYFWVPALKPYLSDINNFLYCPGDAQKEFPSSYLCDPHLGGKKLKDLGKMGKVVLLREREARHVWYDEPSLQSGFYILGEGRKFYSQGQVPAGLKFDPHLPPVHHYRLLKILPGKTLFSYCYFLCGLGLLLWWWFGIRKRR